MSLPIQTDAIRVAILQKYGGIWMDIDNIMLNGTFIKNIKNCELAMIGDDKNKKQDKKNLININNNKIYF